MGYMTWGMPTVPPEAAIPHIARLGFTAVELTVLPQYTTALERMDAVRRAEVRRLLFDHGLQLPALAAHFGLLAPRGDEARLQMDALEAAVHLAVDLGGPAGPPCIDTTTGGNTGDWDTERGRLVERTGELCRLAAREGVVVALEPHVNSCLDRPELALWLLREVGAPNLRLNLDISHFHVQGIDLEPVCAVLGPLAAHVHVKDATGRAPDFAFVPPGAGTFDCGAFLRAMHRVGYSGSVTVEVSIMVQRLPGYDPFRAADASYAWLRTAFAAAGLTPER